MRKQTIFATVVTIIRINGTESFNNPHWVVQSPIKAASLDRQWPNGAENVQGQQRSWAIPPESDGCNDGRDKGFGILQASAKVGVLTAAMGFLYGKILQLTVSLIWMQLPSFLSRQGVVISPAWFITSVCSFGGLAMGLLSSKYTGALTVADFVAAFSSIPAASDRLPPSRNALLPLLVLSLVTSTFGFSVGPEAPMVCAGALLGASMARQWYGSETDNVEILAYAGAAGALTAFMGIPIAGSIFALELTRSSAGLSTTIRDAISPAVAASAAALIVIRAILLPSKSVGGHFSYGDVGALSGRAMISVALISSVGGAFLGTIFHKTVSGLKGMLWPAGFNEEKTALSNWQREVFVKTILGFAVGLLSSSYPQTLFWGEGSLQCMVDGQRTAFSATKHGLSTFLTSSAKIDPSLPFVSAGAAVQVGIAKLVAIALACAGKFPGGIIFPLFFAAAPLAHACSSLMPSSILPVAVMSLMASTQASVTRTPLATALILTLSASASTELSTMLPAVLIASYGGVWVSQFFSTSSYFKYSK